MELDSWMRNNGYLYIDGGWVRKDDYSIAVDPAAEYDKAMRGSTRRLTDGEILAVKVTAGLPGWKHTMTWENNGYDCWVGPNGTVVTLQGILRMRCGSAVAKVPCDAIGISYTNHFDRFHAPLEEQP